MTRPSHAERKTSMKPSAQANGAKLRLILAVVIFGTIGIFVRSIPLPSSIIAMTRAFVGVLCLLAVLAVMRRPLDRATVRRYLPLLIASGIAIGFNWVLLFEAYRYTTVATATLCYYFAPIFILLASPLLLGERLTTKKVLCILVALVGMALVSGVVETGIPSLAESRGILFGFGAAVLYAAAVLMNQKCKDIGPYDRTLLQLAVAGVVLVPYNLLTIHPAELSATPLGLFLLLVVGVIHTGLGYTLYFGSMSQLPAQTVALFSYLDPVVAILLSALLLHERMGAAGAVGAVLVLGATLLSELPERKKSFS